MYQQKRTVGSAMSPEACGPVPESRQGKWQCDLHVQRSEPQRVAHGVLVMKSKEPVKN